MAEAEVLIRKYSGADGHMATTARVIYTIFNANLSDFTAFDSTLDAAFAAAFLASVLAAEGLISDNVVIDRVAEKTENVENAMIAGRDKYGEVKYFSQKAFSSKPILNQFGINDYEEARKSPHRMLTFLVELHATAVLYQSQLMGAGYDATKIAEILTIHETLRTAYEAQGEAMKARPVTTQDRIIVLNTCYLKMTEVNAAAQFVYAGDAARQAQYVFDPSSNAYDGPGVYEGIIAGGASVEAVHIHYKAERTLQFENTGSTALKFFLSGGGLAPQGNTIDVDPGHTSPLLTMADLDATGNHVIVKNGDGAVVGNYKVTVGKF